MMVTVVGLALVGVSSVFKPSAGAIVTSPAHAALGNCGACFFLLIIYSEISCVLFLLQVFS